MVPTGDGLVHHLQVFDSKRLTIITKLSIEPLVARATFC